MVNIVHKMIKRYKRKLKQKSCLNVHLKTRDRNPKLYKLIDVLIEQYRKSGGLSHEYQAYKLYCLYNLLYSHNPKSILEFGSGSSTLLFGHYVKNAKASFLSIDENEKWALNTKQLVYDMIGISLNIIHSPKIFVDTKKTLEMRYAYHPKGYFDFVFIDGPSLRINDVQYKNAVNSDVFSILPLPKVIVVDVRRATAEHLIDKYKDFYEAKLSDLFSDGIVGDNYNYFSIFINKNNDKLMKASH
ncbi:hypothetical protein [uncultured Desulfobacter sp.]|uniref:hypothetical protein n=1 Tax=uncultured Desulfobacter sp. TaxID=240139 RepID=UPI0029F5758F|nr:hypothetical protein [uncultured Desulfobacter sp.]